MCFGISVVFFQAEDGIRDLVRSRGLGDVYKRQAQAMRETSGRLEEIPGEDAFPAYLDSSIKSVYELSLIHI